MESPRTSIVRSRNWCQQNNNIAGSGWLITSQAVDWESKPHFAIESQTPHLSVKQRNPTIR